MKSILLGMLCLVWLTGLSAQANEATPVAIKSGQRMVCVGDSITVAAAKADGYAMLAQDGLKANGIDVKVTCDAGSGANSWNMLTNKYLFPCALGRNPDWITISCGVNDAKVDGNKCSLEQFKSNVTSMVDQALASHRQLVLLTTTAWECLQDSDYRRNIIQERNRQLEPYNTFIRALAVEKRCRLADVNTAFQSIQKASFSTNGILTLQDGCHPNAAGHKVMATVLLKALGLTDAQLEKVGQSWAANGKNP